KTSADIREKINKIDKSVPTAILGDAKSVKLGDLEFESYKKIDGWQKRITAIEKQGEKPMSVLRKLAAKLLARHGTRLTDVELQAQRQTHLTLTELKSRVADFVSKASLKMPLVDSRRSSSSAKRSRSWSIKDDSKRGVALASREYRAAAP